MDRFQKAYFFTLAMGSDAQALSDYELERPPRCFFLQFSVAFVGSFR